MLKKNSEYLNGKISYMIIITIIDHSDGQTFWLWGQTVLCMLTEGSEQEQMNGVDGNLIGWLNIEW